MCKTNQGSDGGFTKIALLILQAPTRVRFLLLSPKEGKSDNSYVEKPLCSKCRRKHYRKCLVGMGNCYGCGNSDHMKRYCPMMKDHGTKNAQAQECSPNSGAPKKNHFCALQSRGDQQSSLDVVTGMLHYFLLIYILCQIRELHFHL